MALDSRIAAVTDRIIERSRPTRRRYLELMAEQKERGINRPRLSCGNFAHGFAAAGEDKEAISHLAGPNIGIVTAYNDMLSALRRRLRVAYRRCATGSPRASRAWTCRCSAAT